MRAVVLVIDDEEVLARSIKRALEDRGHVVTLETNSRRGLELLLSPAEFDVTILDLLMPQPTGGMIIDALRKQAPARLPRVMVLSGLGYLAERFFEEIRREGILVREKPYDATLLARDVEQFAALTIPRGPVEENMPPKRDTSHPEIPALYDEEIEVTTGVIELVESTPGIPKEARQELRIRYLTKTVTDMKKIVDGIEDLQKTVKFLVKWMPIAAAGAATIFEATRWLMAHIVFK